MFFKWKLKKLNKQAEKEYIETLERCLKEWKDLAHEYSLKYWELKARQED